MRYQNQFNKNLYFILDSSLHSIVNYDKLFKYMI